MTDKSSTDINKIVSDEIVEKSIDLSIEYSEIALDEFLKDGILKEIPIVKSIVSFYNISSSIIDRHKTKKILTFFKEFHSKHIDEKKLEVFKNKFNSDDAYRRKVVETIVLLNERFYHIEKTKILANLFISYIEEEITWQEFVDISFVLDNFHPRGFTYLKALFEVEFKDRHKDAHEGEGLMFACGIGYRFGNRFTINSLGKKFYNFGLKKTDLKIYPQDIGSKF